MTMTLESIREKRVETQAFAQEDLDFLDELTLKDDLSDSDRKKQRITEARVSRWNADLIQLNTDENNLLAGKMPDGSNERWEKVDAFEAYIKGAGPDAIRNDHDPELIGDDGNFVIDYPQMIGTVNENPLLNVAQTHPNDDKNAWGVDVMPDPMNLLEEQSGVITTCVTRNTPNGRRYEYLQLTRAEEGDIITGTGTNEATANDINFTDPVLVDYDISRSNLTHISLAAEEDSTIRGSLAAYFTELLVGELLKTQAKAVSIGGVANQTSRSFVSQAIPAHVTATGVGTGNNTRRLNGLDLDALLARIGTLISAVKREYRNYRGGRRLTFLCSDEFLWSVLVPTLRDTDKRSLLQFMESGITGQVIARLYGIPITIDNNFAVPTGANLDVPANSPIMGLYNGDNYELRRVSRISVNVDRSGTAGQNYQRTIQAFQRFAGHAIGPFIKAGETNAGKATSLAMWQAAAS